MGNQYLALSLFLMLLSFFIIMNASSGFEDAKASPVLNSLSLAFSNKTMEQGLAPENTDSEGFVIGVGDSLQQMESLFNAEIAGFEATRNRFGTTMHVRVPVIAFERAIDVPKDRNFAVPRGQKYIKGRGAFLPTLVSMLKAEQKNMPYAIEIVLNTVEEPAVMVKNNPAEFDERLSKIASIADKIEEDGLSQEYISASLKKGENGFLDLYFRPWASPALPEENPVQGAP